MTPEEIAVKLTAVEDRSKSNTRRIDALEEEQKDTHRLAVAVEVMAAELKAMKSDFAEVAADVRTLKDEPGNRWKQVVGYLLAALASGVVTFIITKLF